MFTKEFFTEKRLDVISKIFVNTGQALVIAGIIGGLFEKFQSIWLKVLFLGSVVVLLVLGVLLADINLKKEV